MKHTWVLVTNGSQARLFETEKAIKTLTLLKEYEHPESRMKSRDLASDRSGHFSGESSGAPHGAFNETSDPKSNEMERFAEELAVELNKGRNDHNYNRLVIISSPRFQGIFNKHINPQVSKLINRHIDKDFTTLPPKELLRKLH